MDHFCYFCLSPSWSKQKVILKQNHFCLLCLAVQTAVRVPSNVSQGERAVIIISIVIASLFSSSEARSACGVSMNAVLCVLSWSVSESGKGRRGGVWGLVGVTLYPQ